MPIFTSAPFCSKNDFIIKSCLYTWATRFQRVLPRPSPPTCPNWSLYDRDLLNKSCRSHPKIFPLIQSSTLLLTSISLVIYQEMHMHSAHQPFFCRTECGKCGKMAALSAEITESAKMNSYYIFYGLCYKGSHFRTFVFSEGSYVVIRPTVQCKRATSRGF